MVSTCVLCYDALLTNLRTEACLQRGRCVAKLAHRACARQEVGEKAHLSTKSVESYKVEQWYLSHLCRW